jgi:hypothetical protein
MKSLEANIFLLIKEFEIVSEINMQEIIEQAAQ